MPLGYQGAYLGAGYGHSYGGAFLKQFVLIQLLSRATATVA